MSFKPNVNGPDAPMGKITVTTNGTGVPLDTNWSPQLRPGTPVSDAAKEQYAISLEDIVISPNPANVGGLFLIQNNPRTDVSSRTNTDTILLFIPKGSQPIHLTRFLGGNRFQPGNYALDAEQDGDWANVLGIVTA